MRVSGCDLSLSMMASKIKQLKKTNQLDQRFVEVLNSLVQK